MAADSAIREIQSYCKCDLKEAIRMYQESDRRKTNTNFKKDSRVWLYKRPPASLKSKMKREFVDEDAELPQKVSKKQLLEAKQKVSKLKQQLEAEQDLLRFLHSKSPVSTNGVTKADGFKPKVGSRDRSPLRIRLPHPAAHQSRGRRRKRASDRPRIRFSKKYVIRSTNVAPTDSSDDADSSDDEEMVERMNEDSSNMSPETDGTAGQPESEYIDSDMANSDSTCTVKSIYYLIPPASNTNYQAYAADDELGDSDSGVYLTDEEMCQGY